MKMLNATYEINGKVVNFNRFEHQTPRPTALSVQYSSITKVETVDQKTNQEQRWIHASSIYCDIYGHRGTNGDVQEVLDIINKLMGDF